MPTLAVDGADIWYEERGSGPPILGIHGTPSSALLWVDAAEVLSALGRCIVYDRRGFGRSTRVDARGTLDLSDHVEDAVALLTALSAAPATVIGRSTGGQIALELARRHPSAVRALVLLEPAVFTLDPRSDAWAAAAREAVLHAAEADPDAAAEAVLRFALGDPAWEAIPADLQALFRDASPSVLAEIRGRGLDLSPEALLLDEADLAGIAQPTLLVTSQAGPEACRLVNERLARTMPNARTLVVGGGHLIDPAHEGVLEFVQGLPAPE